MVLTVRLHLHGPAGGDEAFNAQTFAPTPHDLTQPARWWGAFAVRAAQRLEQVLRDGQRDMLTVSGLPIVNVPFRPFDSTGIELHVGTAAVPVHEFTVE